MGGTRSTLSILRNSGCQKVKMSIFLDLFSMSKVRKEKITVECQNMSGRKSQLDRTKIRRSRSSRFLSIIPIWGPHHAHSLVE